MLGIIKNLHGLAGEMSVISDRIYRNELGQIKRELIAASKIVDDMRARNPLGTQAMKVEPWA